MCAICSYRVTAPQPDPFHRRVALPVTRGILRSEQLALIQLDQGQISATTNGSGKGGSVDVSAGKSLTISGANGGIISLTAPPPTAALDAFALKLSPFFVTRFGVATPNFAALLRQSGVAGSLFPLTPGYSTYSVP